MFLLSVHAIVKLTAISYFQLNNFLLCVRESSIVGSQRPVQLESYNFFFIKLSFFSIYIFCSVVRAVYNVPKFSLSEFIRTSFVELRIPSNFIVEWRIPSIFIFRITNSFELHLLSYEFIRSSFFELRIHSNFICWVTNSFELHLSSYEFIRTSFAELRIHSNFICRVTNSFEFHLSSYEFIRTSFIELRTQNSKNST